MKTLPAPRSPWMHRLVLSLAMGLVLGLILWTLAQRKDRPQDTLERARFLLERGQVEQALAIASRFSRGGPDAAEALTLTARALLMRGAISPARLTLERSLALKLEQPEATKLLAAIYIAGGDGQRGVAMLKKAADLDAADFRPWYALGKLYHDMGKLEDSAAAYSQAIAREIPQKEARESRIGRARALLDANKAEQASEDLDALRQQAPDDAEALALAARQARDLGHAEEAERLADRAIAADPLNFDALLARARIRFLSPHPERAIGDLEKALEARPNDIATLQLLYQTQKRAGMIKEAETTSEAANRARERIKLMDRLTKVIDQNPTDPEPRWQMGEAAMDGKLFVLAYQCFQAALDLDPNYQPARDSLKTLRSQKGFDYTAAVKLQLQVPNRTTTPSPGR